MNWINVKDNLPPYNHKVLGVVKSISGTSGKRQPQLVARMSTDVHGENWDVFSEKTDGQFKVHIVEWWVEIPKPPKK